MKGHAEVSADPAAECPSAGCPSAWWPSARYRGSGRPAYRRRLGLTSVLLAAMAVVAPQAAAGVPPHSQPASPTATPSPPSSLSVVVRTDGKLPKPQRSLDPALTVGGPGLASMGLLVQRPASVPAPPSLPCVAWLLADMDTGDVVAAKAPHAQLLPASTLKALTALVTLPSVDASSRFRATDADLRAEGTLVGMVPGLTYTGKDLFNALIMASANDAAYALARIHGGEGGIRATLAEMNAQAAWLGAHDTVARDPAGLDAPGQRSSPYDLALIGRAVMQLPEFRAYAVRKQASFPGASKPGGKRGSFMISNHDKLLYNYPGTIGIKNGYTEKAHQTLISAVQRGGRTYLLAEMYGTSGSWRPAAAMFDWAFAHGSQVTPVGRLVDPGEVPTPPTAQATTVPGDVASPGATAAGEVGETGRGGGPADLDPTSVLADLGALRGMPGGGAVVLIVLAAVTGWFLVRRRLRARYPSRHRT